MRAHGDQDEDAELGHEELANCPTIQSVLLLRPTHVLLKSQTLALRQ